MNGSVLDRIGACLRREVPESGRKCLSIAGSKTRNRSCHVLRLLALEELTFFMDDLISC